MTKEKLVQAISEFILDDIANDIKDATVKAIAIAGTKVVKKNPQVIDKVLSNEWMQLLLDADDNGEYNTDLMEEVLKETVNETGRINLTIPAIPVLHPSETVLGLTPVDLEKLFIKLHS